MLQQPLSCCRAAQRRVRIQSDAIWITEDTLSRSFQRFLLITRLFRRDGSSVPGPLESRRRLGKRRMANVVESVQPPASDFGTSWGFGGIPMPGQGRAWGVDRDQWQWEAPKTRKPAPKETSTQFPAWLSNFEPTPLNKLPAGPEEDEPSIPSHETLLLVVKDDLRIFRKSLRASSADQVQNLCESFNARLTQNITLGLVPMDVLALSLRDIMKDIEKLALDKRLARPLYFSLLTAVWDGIKACKVLRPVDLGSETLNTLLSLLAHVPPTHVIQALATEMIQAAASDSVTDIEDGMLCLIKAWIASWIDLEAYESGRSKNRDQEVPWSLEKSVTLLAKLMGRLLPHIASQIIHICTDFMIKSCFANFLGHPRVLRRLRYSWLSAVANTPCIDEDLLIQICIKMDVVWPRAKERIKMGIDPSKAKGCSNYAPSIPRLPMREMCKLLLDFWISHGQIKAAERVKTTFTMAIEGSRRPDDVAYLLRAVDEHKDLCWAKARSLFRFLRCMNKPQAIYHSLLMLRNHNIRFTASQIAQEIQQMACIDLRNALNIYNLYHTIRHDNKPLLLDGCPEQVMAMIKSSQFAPGAVWGAMGIQLYDPRRLSLSPKPLPQARIELVQRMAMEFAQADSRSHRVAFRNVMQCAMYLRRHRVPMSPELSRAISCAGITRKLLQQRWIGTEKAVWILDLIRQTEGAAVAGETGRAVYLWRIEHMRQRRLSTREENPLRVGLID